MPVWLKVSLITLGTLAILGALAVYIFARMIGGIFDGFVEGFSNPTGAAPAVEAGPQQIQFLQTEGFDPASPGAAIILHPAFTGLPEPVAVTDPAVLSSAAESAFFTDNRSAETGMVLLSILFLSPPGNGTRATMVSLFQDGHEVATLTCYTGQCPRQGPPTAPYDLAGLDAAAQPVVYELETITGAAAARAFAADLRTRPGHFVAHGLEGLPDPAQRFNGFVWLDLPTTFGPWDANTSYGGTAERAAFEVALADFRSTLPFGVEFDRISTGGQWSQYQIIDRATDLQAVEQTGFLASDGYLPQFNPSARIWVETEDVDALRESVEAYDWPVPANPPADEILAARLPEVLAERGLPGAPEDYTHRVVVHDVRDTLSLSDYAEPEVIFGYYVVAP